MAAGGSFAAVAESVMREVFLSPEYVPDASGLTRFLHLEPGSEEEADFLALLERTAKTAKPRAACRAALVEEAEDGVAVAGMRLGRGLPTDRLGPGSEVYFFVATCGVELERAGAELEQLERFWFDAIMREALLLAEAEARKFVAAQCGHTHFASIGPGSLPAWPLEGQRELFAFLAEQAAWCGIRLDGNCVMHPQKSTSGVLFPVNGHWRECGACPRENCRERKESFRP